MKKLFLASTVTLSATLLMFGPNEVESVDVPHSVLCEPQIIEKTPAEVKPVAPKKLNSTSKPVESKQVIQMEVTGYTAGYESTQKHPGDPAYGLTASGEMVEQGVTVAAGSNIPFGTRIYIPYFDGKPGFGDGVFTVQDRGGAIGPYNIDVYYDDLGEAIDFGRQILDIEILGGEVL